MKKIENKKDVINQAFNVIKKYSDISNALNILLNSYLTERLKFIGDEIKVSNENTKKVYLIKRIK